MNRRELFGALTLWPFAQARRRPTEMKIALTFDGRKCAEAIYPYLPATIRRIKDDLQSQER